MKSHVISSVRVGCGGLVLLAAGTLVNRARADDRPEPIPEPMVTITPPASPTPFITPTPDAGDCNIIDILDHPGAVAGEKFGGSVDAIGSVCVIGAPSHSVPAFFSGIAILMDLSNFNVIWTWQNPTPALSDRFGSSAAISLLYTLVGAASDDTGASNAGSAYLFDNSSGTLIHTYNNPSPASSDSFGGPIAMSDIYTCIGSTGKDLSVQNQGIIYVYDTETRALLRTLDNPFPAANDFFGVVAVFGDRALVGATGSDVGGTDRGAAFLFDLTDGSLLQTFLNPSLSLGFGKSLGLSQDYALIANGTDGNDGTTSGRVWLFDVTTGGLVHTFANPAPYPGDLFGSSVALAGGRVLIGAPGQDTTGLDSGAAWLYDAATAGLLAMFRPDAPSGGDGFGGSVALTSQYALVGNPGDDTMAGADAGSAYLYAVSCITPTPAAPTPTTTPAAASPAPTASPSGPACFPGDADNSCGFVDAADFISVQANFGADNGVGGPGDANCSGSFVDASDFIAVQANFGADCG